jgi:hypothetical protein
MDLSLASISAAPGDQDAPVFVVEMSGAADCLGIDHAYDAILRVGRNRRARVVVDVAAVSQRDFAEPMLFAACEALEGRLTVIS